MLKFKILRSGLRMIAKITKDLNMDVVFKFTEDKIIIHQFDTARTRAVVIEYPIFDVDGDIDQLVAVRTDWLYKKVNLLDGNIVDCDIDEAYFIINQIAKDNDLVLQQEYKINRLVLEGLTERATFDELPSLESTVFCELPNIRMFRKAIAGIETDNFRISALDNQLILESVHDYTAPEGKVVLETPLIINEKNNRTRYERTEIFNFVGELPSDNTTTITFSKDGPMIITSENNDIKIKGLFAYIAE